MIQGTTPTIRLRLPMDSGHVSRAEFVIGDYEDRIEGRWTEERMERDGNDLILRLTQEDTLRISPGIHLGQLRVTTDDGETMATDVMRFRVGNLLSGVTI